MTKDFISGLVVGGAGVDWSVLQPGREGVQRVAGGHAVSTPGPEAVDVASPVDLLALTLKTFAAQLRGPLTLGLAADQVLVRVLKLPAGDDAEIAGMVEIQAEKLIPFPVDNMVIGHEVLQRGTDAHLVLIAGARLDLVERAGASLQKAGLTAQRVDAAALGWWRALRESGRLDAAGCRIEVALEATAAEVLVLRGGVPLTFRTLWGGTGTLDAQELAREINFTLVALELEHGAVETPHLTIWTGGVEPTPVWREAFAVIWGSAPHYGRLADLPSAAEGVARRAREPGTLDLTPASWLAARQKAQFRKRLLMSTGGILAAWLLAVGSALGWLAFEQHRLAVVEAERDTLRGPALSVRETRRRVFMVQRYLDTSGSALECLREISTLLPPGVEMTSFSYHKGEEVKISATAGAVAAVYDFKGRLDGSSVFAGATLQGPRDAPNGQQLFDVTLQLREDQS